jgi:hypothetical protein
MIWTLLFGAGMGMALCIILQVLGVITVDVTYKEDIK